jgi:hypothetical protein
MSKASKSSASEHTQLEGYEGHFEDFGPYTVGFETYTADAARAPLFAGLPDDHCQCPHMGYVIKGRLKFVFADGTEGITNPMMRTTLPPRRCTPDRRLSSSAQPSNYSRRSRWSSRNIGGGSHRIGTNQASASRPHRGANEGRRPGGLVDGARAYFRYPDREAASLLDLADRLR